MIFLKIKARGQKEMPEVDKEFVEYVVKSIVAHPDDVSIERTLDERGVLLTLKINPADMGYLIGKQGQTIRAIRTLLRIVGTKNNARVNLKVVEPEGSKKEGNKKEASSDNSTDVVDDLKI